VNFGQAWDVAGAILTLLALIPAGFIALMMSWNLGNPNFDMISAFNSGMNAIVNAVIPALGTTVILALIIYIAANSSGH